MGRDWRLMAACVRRLDRLALALHGAEQSRDALRRWLDGGSWLVRWWFVVGSPLVFGY